MDGNLTSSGVTLTSPSVLYLEVDLSQRIKVDGIRLYADDLSKISNIKFYSKNAEGDSYTPLITATGTSYYYTTITSPSAPQFVRATISGVAIELYEFQVFNDDYIVAFGADGSQYSEYLDNTPVGELGTPEVIKIFNNGTGAMPADAYACIDYTENDADWYVKIAASENGTYYGLADGVGLEDNGVGSVYIWDMGDYGDNTTTVGDNLTLLSAGTYLSDTDKVCDLPLTNGSESLNVGSSAMTYDSVNDVIYALGCEASPTILKLYKYDIPTNDWTYLWEVNPGTTNFEDTAGITYLNGYVYIMTNYNYNFGRYNMVTMSGVWEPLTIPTGMPPSSNLTAISIDGDGNNYVYLAAVYSTTKSFQRYNTTSGTWDVLNNGFGHQYSHYTYGCVVSISYDTERDYVYSIAGNYSTYAYVSRYDVSTDTWNANYLNRTTRGGSPISSTIAYYDDYIFLYSHGSTATAYLYHIPTDSSKSVSVGDPTIHAIDGGIYGDHKTFMCIIDPQKGNDTMSILFGCVDGHMDELYGYNMTPIYTSSGTYYSPVFKMPDADSSSYFLSNVITTSGISNVSYDAGSYNGTIRVRSSAIEPVPVNEIYWTSEVSNNVYVYRYDLDTGIGGDWLGITLVASTESYGNTDVDRRTGHIASTCSRYYTGKGDYNTGQIKIYDRSGSTLYSKSSTRYYRLDRHLEFDSLGGLWGYEAVSYYLLHFDYQLAAVLANVYTGSDFLYDLAAELNGQGIWYTDSINNIVVHRNSAGTLLQQITLLTPRAICGTNDNGCWVIDNSDYYARRYTSSGTIFKSVYLGRSAEQMCADYNDGFWYYNGGDSKVYHVNSEGTELVNVYTSNVYRMRAMRDGCMVWSRNNDYVKWVNNDGVVVRTINGPSTTTFCAGVYSHSYNDHVNYHTNALPNPDDAVWGVGGSAKWHEVSRNGYFLSKKQYHQVELTLTTTDIVHTPYVNNLVMAPAVKITDIQAQSSKDMYIRTDIPSSADIDDYETRLKVWWGVEE